MQLAAYRPRWWERLLRTNRRFRQIETEVRNAQKAEAEEEKQAEVSHNDALVKWNAALETANEILAGDLETYDDVLEEMNCLEELTEWGTSPRVRFLSARLAELRLHVMEDSIVPTEEKALTARGRLSRKRLPAGRRQELHQDYVCGASLRGARELLAALPLDAVLIHAEMELLDSTSGHVETRAIMSIFCPRGALASINWEAVDASDLVSRLKHRAAFKRGKGFSAIDPLAPTELTQDVLAVGAYVGGTTVN